MGAGVFYAKCTTPCNSANSSNVTIQNVPVCPTVTATTSGVSPTCSGNTLLVNGEILVTNIINGTQISINNGNFTPLNGLAGTTNSHRYTQLTAGEYTIKLKSSNSNCPEVIYTVTLVSTSCQCLPITANTATTQSPTCTNNVPNQNGSVTITGLVNVNRVSINSVCENNNWSTAQVVTGNSHTISNLATGVYFLKYYTSETCSSSCVSITVTSACCQLALSNPIVTC